MEGKSVSILEGYFYNSGNVNSKNCATTFPPTLILPNKTEIKSESCTVREETRLEAEDRFSLMFRSLWHFFFINLVCSLTTPSECTQWIMVTPTPHPHPSPSSPVSPHSFLQISPLHPLTIVFALLPIDFTMDCITVGLELSFNTWWAHQWIHRERQ